MTQPDWKLIQARLRGLGYTTGPIDGVPGRLTLGAVIAFQKGNHLVPDGIVGPATMAKLFPDAPEIHPDTTPWMTIAKGLLGTKEFPGNPDNPVIMQWASDLFLRNYNGDEDPWCGLFVAHCVATALPAEPLPSNPLGARNFQTLGIACHPQYGAIMPFWRDTPNGWKGHVGFYHHETSSHYVILGGNQNDQVSYASIIKGRLLGARWPKTAMAPTGTASLGGAAATGATEV